MIAQKKIANGTSRTFKKILIVEDDPDQRKFLSYLFKKSGYEVYGAGDGEEGLNMARKERPDLVILDLRLPKCPGEEVCKAIREDQDKGFAHTPIVMLTGKTADVDRVIGNVIGASSYLTKPFHTADLLEQVGRFL